MQFKWWMLVILVFLFITFTIQNMTPVTLKFLFWSISISKTVPIFVALFMGIIIGLVLAKKG